MAGSYPDAPSRRIAYDADGTVGLKRNLSASQSESVLDVPAATLAEWNDEDDVQIQPPGANGGTAPPRYFWWIFPELRELDGFYGRASVANQVGQVATAPDTTNGMDGTWTERIADYDDTSGELVHDSYRTEITSLAVSSIRGVRVQVPPTVASPKAFHLYGTISPGETPDRLLFIDELTGLEFTAPIDFGDVPRGGSEDVELRLRNNSATLAANNIQYTAASLYRASGNWYTFTLPGGATFQSTRQVASLAAATTTGIITLRRITPGDEELWLHAARISATVDTWT